ncbi:hypothetical protein CcaverHIS641_0105590 [Cutaneotrichosporon cavernicola]|nr:hypothetical protein CcaverHIS641_0105590 [Cutaneotrichosporon cavernicola]
MTTPPPSFDQFYHSQGDVNMPSQQSSFDQYTANAFASVSDAEHQFGAIYAQQLGDEPASLTVDEPAHTLNHRSSREALCRHYGLGDPRADVERKDSVPFDPTSSSTLIASASNTPSKQFMHQHQHYSQYDRGSQLGFTPQHRAMSPHVQDLSPQPSDMMSPPQQPDFSFQNHNFYQEPQSLAGTAQTNEWASANDFIQQNGGDPEGDSRRASWAGSQHFRYDEQQQFDDIQRIISNASSHAGTPAPGSRVASPFVPQEHQNMGHLRHDSSSSIARSPSPFGSMAAPSPPVFHTTSASGSPSFSKPQSPPALIIPNSAPSHSFSSVSVAANMNQRSGGSSKFGTSLLPPVNPQLEHLTGMAGISPIAPNADGPMITIQPSTPISPLKHNAHASMFDKVLRSASSRFQQHNQQDQPSPDQHQLRQQPQQQTPSPLSNGMRSPGMGQQSVEQNNTVFASDAQWHENEFSSLAVQGHMRPRSKSDSYMADGGGFDRQAATQLMGGPMAQFFPQQLQQGTSSGPGDTWGNINIHAWRDDQAREADSMTMDPRHLSGQDEAQLQNQLRIEALQRAQLQTNTGDVSSTGVFKYEPDQVSPTTLEAYAFLGLSAPSSGISRRRSFNDGMHPAAGAGTPGYGVQFSMPGAISPGRMRGGSFNLGHRRQVQSEDFSRGGWGIGHDGASTAAFMQAMTNPDDGTLLPPMNRGRSMSHSRHSSVSSVRSPSPALSVSSQGSSYSHHSRMSMPDGVQPELFAAAGGDMQGIAKMKVTSMATEVASQSRRTNSAQFRCPIEGCSSTFTRQFNLKGHMRSHKDERPYKCTYPDCSKSLVGFARQHDCKRHMLLHEKKRPFKCEACLKTFARLDALTRHHRSDQGQQCAESHPLPTNPDGSAMTESQYKARLGQMREQAGPAAGPSAHGGQSSGGVSASASADELDLMEGVDTA